MKKDKMIQSIIVILSSFSVIMLFAIIYFLVIKSLPFFEKHSIVDFISSTKWLPDENQYGIASFIMGTLITTLLAVMIAIPIGLYTAIFIFEILPKSISKIALFIVEVVAGIPSIIFGFFGVVVVAPQLQKIFHIQSGLNMLTTSIILALMILPTMIVLTIAGLKRVDSSLTSASYALGASQVQTIFNVQLFHAKNSIITAVFVACVRALGETMAVIMVAGNAVAFPTLTPIKNLVFQSVRTLTGNIVTEAAYATGTHLSALFATGLVLFVFVGIINVWMIKIKRGI